MKKPRFLLALTVLNLVLVLLLLAQQVRSAYAESALPVLRGRALEIVDEHGRVRASLEVLPAGKAPNGDATAEVVLLRLITERGRPSVKISASEIAAGLSLAGPTGTSDTYVILEAKGTTTSLRLRNEDGQEYRAKP